MIIPRFTDFRHRFATSPTLGPGGYEVWPVALQDAALAISVDDGTNALLALPAIMSVNGGAADAVSGVDEYDWYLSQRTDDTAAQCLSLTSAAGTSSTVTLARTALGTSRYPSGSTDDMRKLYRHVCVYVSRKSDKAWNMIDFSKTLFSENP